LGIGRRRRRQGREKEQAKEEGEEWDVGASGLIMGMRMQPIISCVSFRRWACVGSVGGPVGELCRRGSQFSKRLMAGIRTSAR
jgi:hypothetical protein